MVNLALKVKSLETPCIDESSNPDDSIKMPKNSIETARCLQFFDELFDSIKGEPRQSLPGKRLKCAITSNSGPLKFWNKAIKRICSLQY
ncbi:hypothetical protein Trydic_g13000 [Trypoxylus dichotomus]